MEHIFCCCSPWYQKLWLSIFASLRIFNCHLEKILMIIKNVTLL